MTEKTKCAGRVQIPGMWPRFRNCIRPAKNHEDGKDWCAQHTPSLVKARNAERSARWEAKFEAKMKARERADALSAARAAVVEAAKEYVDAAAHNSADRYDAMLTCVIRLRSLERGHA